MTQTTNIMATNTNNTCIIYRPNNSNMSNIKKSVINNQPIKVTIIATTTIKNKNDTNPLIYLLFLS